MPYIADGQAPLLPPPLHLVTGIEPGHYSPPPHRRCYCSPSPRISSALQRSVARALLACCPLVAARRLRSPLPVAPLLLLLCSRYGLLRCCY